MIFWIGIGVGAFVAWCATQSTFVKTWALCFNLVIAIYVAVFTAPLVTRGLAEEAQQTAYAHALALLAIAGGTLFALCNLCLLLLPDENDVSLPDALNTVLSGVAGFFGGLLVWSFLVVMIYVSPLGETNVMRHIGLQRDRRPANIAYLCAVCDVVHAIAWNGNEKARSSGEVITTMAGLKGHQLVPQGDPEPGALFTPPGLLKPAEPQRDPPK